MEGRVEIEKEWRRDREARAIPSSIAREEVTTQEWYKVRQAGVGEGWEQARRVVGLGVSLEDQAGKARKGREVPARGASSRRVVYQAGRRLD